MNIYIKKEKRKSLSLKFLNDGSFLVKAPYFISDSQIDEFVNSHRKWMEKRLQELHENEPQVRLTEEDIRELADKALGVIPGKVEKYARLLGVTYGRITIRNQRSRWGSCSSSGNLNFNCLLLLMPDEIIDSVVVHELCHRRHMDHSAAFYADVISIYPEYRSCERWLKENGKKYMRMMTG